MIFINVKKRWNDILHNENEAYWRIINIIEYKAK